MFSWNRYFRICTIKFLWKQIILEYLIKNPFLYSSITHSVAFGDSICYKYRDFLIPTSKLFVYPTETFLFLYFTNFTLSESFIFKNIYLSVLIRICNVRTFFEKVLIHISNRTSFPDFFDPCLKFFSFDQSRYEIFYMLRTNTILSFFLSSNFQNLAT